MKAQPLHWILVETLGGAASENTQYSDCAATAKPADGAAGWPFEALAISKMDKSSCIWALFVPLLVKSVYVSFNVLSD